jgi:hypothetical protein
VLALCLPVAIGACSSAPIAGPGYPEGLAQAETLDVQVVRDETHITFTNTSARAIGPGTVWVNRFFAKNIGRVEVGDTLTLDLRDFRNEFGERFRAGGFFATERPKDVVQVQVRENGAQELLGLVVVRGEAVTR